MHTIRCMSAQWSKQDIRYQDAEIRDLSLARAYMSGIEVRGSMKRVTNCRPHEPMHVGPMAKLVKERSLGGPNAVRVNKHRKHEVMEPVHWSISMKGDGHRERQLVP